MASLTLDVIDPETREVVHLTAYLRSGRLVFQQLGSHLFREGLTPARKAAMERFAAVASTSYGERFTGTIPPAAERVRAELAGSRYTLTGRTRRPPRRENQAYYRALVGPEQLRQIEEVLRSVTPTNEPPREWERTH